MFECACNEPDVYDGYAVCPEHDGFTETDSLASDAAVAALREKLMRPEFLVTITVHTLDGNSFPIPNVREDSITYESRKGVPLLVFERPDSDALGYVPNVAYWATHCE
jgi:hypothetical protein